MSPWTRQLSKVHPPLIKDSLLELIGQTPLVRLERIGAQLPPGVELWAKLEFMNPGGSIKDRPARQIMLDALEDGRLDASKILIDATSGNTGVAYAMLGAALGIPVQLVMPGNVSAQRRHIISTFGAQIISSDPMEGSDGAIRLVRKLLAEDDQGRYFYADQYGNPSNPRAHELSTAPEIFAQTQGRVTHFVACTGTSGTIMGTGRGLKALNPQILILGAQPDDAFHGLEGLKHMPSSLVPAIYQEHELDQVCWVRTEDGWDMASRLALEEGIAAGHSAGANVFAALQVARSLEQGVVVTVICDHADRYLGE